MINKTKTIALTALLVLTIVLTGCTSKSSNYSITKLNIGKSQYSKLLEIANSNEEVTMYLQNVEYSVNISKVTAEDKAQLPSVYKDLEEKLYKVYYKTKGFDLLVIMNKEEVLKVIPVTKLTI